MRILPRLVLPTIAALALTGCGGGGTVDATQLTIVTTVSDLDHAVSLAVAQYVADQDVTVKIEHEADTAAVFAQLEQESDTASDHAVVGIVTAQQEPDTEDQSLQLPDSLATVAQAPADLDLVAATSKVTAVRFAQQQDPLADDPLATACDAQIWLHNLAAPGLETVQQSLEEQGCQPAFEAVEATDLAPHDELGERLTIEHDTVALLSGVDPMLADLGLTTLDVAQQQWAHGSVVAVAGSDFDDPLAGTLDVVLREVDRAAATQLLRGYRNAQTSTSDLQYDVDNAIRYWLATHGLADPDTVIDISPDI